MKSVARIVPFLILCSVCLAAPEPIATGTGPQPTAYARKGSLGKSLHAPDHPPHPVRQRQPVYPDKWKAWGQPGYAIVVVLVDEYGNAEKAQCTEATDLAFARAAEKSLTDCFFRPALKNQQAVRGLVTVRLDYENPTKVTAKILPAAEPAR